MKWRSALMTFSLLATTLVPTANALTSSAVASSCFPIVKKKVLGTITGQSEALRKQDFSAAITYATAQFRTTISLKDFTQIIHQNFNFLEKTATIQIIDCQQIGQFIYLGTQITDTSKVMFYLVYLLQPQNKKELITPNKTGYGIAAAQLGKL